MTISRRSGRTYLQLPGPTNVPPEVLAALAAPTLDHRGEQFQAIARSVLTDLPALLGTRPGHVALYAASGTGGWEAALVNAVAPGSTVLAPVAGFFSTRWAELAGRIGYEVLAPGCDWRRAVAPDVIAGALKADGDGRIAAVMVVHNETSTGVTTDVAAVRSAMDEVGHPALLLVDAVSSAATRPVCHDGWGVDVTVTASQKGLMLPPGLAIVAVSDRAIEAASRATRPVGYWDWTPMLAAVETGSFPATPANNMVVALRVALDLIAAEGATGVFSRHARHAHAAQAAVDAWGLPHVPMNQAERSVALTAVLLPDGVDDVVVRRRLEAAYGLTLGGGLGRLTGRCLRIGHLGDLDDLMLVSVLAGVELGLPAAGLPLGPGGVAAALAELALHPGLPHPTSA
jgi:alanine-glyoxylate transaminase/serine-glyoxylate transaminase/serine-pyruvate transaminase